MIRSAALDTPLPDHYATLGLDRRCTLAQIRAAYRLLAKRHHPDVNGSGPEAAEQTRRLNAANEVLSDPARRRAYDRELSESEAAPPPTRASRIEKNIAHEVRLRIDEFIRGTTLDVRVSDPGKPNGAETYELTIPPETAPGTRFRIPRDEPFAGGFVIVRVKALPGFRFKVRGSDLQCELRIDARRGAQGCTETISGATGRPLRVTVPRGVARGEVIRVRGEGLPKPRGGRGDLLVRVTYRAEVKVTRR